MFERMLDKSNKPSAEEMEIFCAENGTRFKSLNDFLLLECKTVCEIRFPYGNSYGWCVTHRRGKKLVCDVFAEAGAFTVMLRLSDKQFSSKYADLSDYTKKYIDNRYPCGDGGWIHYRVTSADNFDEIKILLGVKCE